MNKKFIRGAISVIITLVLVLGLFAMPSIDICAKEEAYSYGFEQPIVEFESITEEEYERRLFEEETGRIYQRSFKATDGYWSQFSSPYYNYYNCLSDEQKVLYDELYSTLYGMIEGGSNCTRTSFSGVGCYATPSVVYSNLTDSQVMDVGYLMLFDHPELYFLSQYAKVSSVGGTSGIIRFSVYDDFASARARLDAANRLKESINWYLEQVNPNASAYDREKQIHDLIVLNCYYGGPNTRYSQSCASVFLNTGGESVCAGYSEAFCLLCNASGIPAFSVTSRGHEWSQVKLGDYWYAVDVTWDDSQKAGYKYFNKSDATIRKGNSDHNLEDLWTRVGRESCPYDWGDVISGIYMCNHTYNNITAGLVIRNADVRELEFQWLGYDYNTGGWFVISDWNKGYEWCSWNPGKTGKFLLLGKARRIGQTSEITSSCIGLEHRQFLKAICQMPNPDGGFLIGVSSFDNPNNAYRYEMLILDCSLLAAGNPYPWIYSTGKMNVNGSDTAWTIWRPVYGYYWTLFRIYDSYGNMLDEECYGFANV